MKFNQHFYKDTGFYLSLVFIVGPLSEMIGSADPFDDVVLSLVILIGLACLSYALFHDEDSDWLIRGNGRRIGFNRCFYRNPNLYLGLFFIVADLPKRDRSLWDDLFLVVGLVVTACALLERKD